MDLTGEKFVQIWEKELIKTNKLNGLFITMNSPWVVLPKQYHRLDITAEKDVQRFQKLLRETSVYAFGKKARLRRELVSTPFTLEIGEETNKLHFHALIAHEDETRRKLSDITQFMHRGQQRLFGKKYSESMIDVRLMGDFRQRLRYMTKQSYRLHNGGVKIVHFC